MLLSQALDAVLKFTPKEFSALSDLLSPELIDECLADTGVVALRGDDGLGRDRYVFVPLV